MTRGVMARAALLTALSWGFAAACADTSGDTSRTSAVDGTEDAQAGQHRDAAVSRDAFSEVDARWAGCSDGPLEMPTELPTYDRTWDGGSGSVTCDCSESAPCPLDCRDPTNEECLQTLRSLDEVEICGNLLVSWTHAQLRGPTVRIYYQDRKRPREMWYDLCTGRLVGVHDWFGYLPNGCRGVIPENHAEDEVPQSPLCYRCGSCDLAAAVAHWRAGYYDLPEP
jgi:hypothetical protein